MDFEFNETFGLADYQDNSPLQGRVMDLSLTSVSTYGTKFSI